MSQEPIHIKAHIREQGESLKSNLEEIQNRFRDALDWKVWYRKNTALALGGFALGGVALALLLPKTSGQRGFPDTFDADGSRAYMARPYRGVTESHSPSRVRQAFDTTLSAVLGVAADKLQEVMSQALPGFREHYAEARRRRADQESQG
jgi:hypothetical protein